ncbi:ankyrin repeat-containing domain protein [Mycena capillaripes]|nr:ankyrin repeat-containing domain protein [Mycena capillaripes]
MFKLPPELILLLSSSLSPKSLSSLAVTCRCLHAILQPELDTLITPGFGRKLLLRAAIGKPYIVAKLLAPPYLIPPSDGYHNLGADYDNDLDEEDDDDDGDTPLHVAANAGNHETASLLLAAGADPAATCGQDEYQPLHLAALKADLPMISLLLDHGAPVDAYFGSDGCRETALHYACWNGHLAVAELLIARGANMERYGHNGSTLGAAVVNRQMDVIRMLLGRGANAAVTVPFFVLMCGLQIGPHYTALSALNNVLEQTQDKCLKDIARLLRHALPDR